MALTDPQQLGLTRQAMIGVTVSGDVRLVADALAAIPAVVIYNFFARAITGYRLRLNETAASVERLVSRDLDRAAAGIRV